MARFGQNGKANQDAIALPIPQDGIRFRDGGLGLLTGCAAGILALRLHISPSGGRRQVLKAISCVPLGTGALTVQIVALHAASRAELAARAAVAHPFCSLQPSSTAISRGVVHSASVGPQHAAWTALDNRLAHQPIALLYADRFTSALRALPIYWCYPTGHLQRGGYRKLGGVESQAGVVESSLR